MRKSWVGMGIALFAGVFFGLPTAAHAADVTVNTTVTVQPGVTVDVPVSVSVRVNGNDVGGASSRAGRRSDRHQK
jgi:hypothetical protein